MPIARFQMPDGRIARFEVPDGTTPEQAQTMMAEHFDKPEKVAAPAKTTFAQDIAQGVGNLAAGAVRGAGSIGATLLAPVDAAARALNNGQPVNVGGIDIVGQDRRTVMDGGLQNMGAQPDSFLYGAGKLGGEIAGTAGAGGLIGQGVVRAAPLLARAGVSAPAVANTVNALTTSGMRAGTATGIGGMALRSGAGAVAGGSGAALIDPQHAGAGAVIGGALPPALAGVGKVGRAIGAKLAGPAATPEMRAAVTAARDVGYVIPPTQAKPTMANRLMEGYAGKLTTAQNASARNQPITNELARKAIGAENLTEAGIAKVRATANKAYDELGQFGAFRADSKFQKALDAAGASTKEMRENFPELVNTQIDDVVAGLRSRPEFSAKATIEAMKQFRAKAAANKAALDPATKEMGRAQAKIAAALEDMVERNLENAGQGALLETFRTARQTLAKTHDVAKALNKETGTVNANKLAQLLQKDRPISGELKQIAQFAARFPTANKTVEQMGSLPGISPLDFAALRLGAIAGAVVGRPAARAAVLSGPVQNRLATGPGAPLIGAGTNQLLHRTAPALSDR